ncbi:DUF1302 domain-containing protein [Solimonas sp. K1W22B-7]|uniref:DUF1302 domain-containing protein n=1 Tax=Solimonas sp. K1W22B-7 TaxID=2303331 RepID=UPI000E32FB2B|nr:DUF1302 domain-containing protein [Solimonas sp. K1W22B-7]AXQ28022.1 DUF1302 domain-containing protein [Solimonas sp. K1W22B-7]
MYARRKHRAALILGAALAATPPAQAFESRFGDATLQVDTLLTAGVAVRVQDRDPGLVSRGNGGTGLSSNIDDGNLNYDRGDITYAPLQFNQDLNLSWGDYGAFVRIYGYYDPVNAEFDEAALNGRRRDDRVVEAYAADLRLLDGYAYGNFELADMPLSLRIGNQVVSWGESTFIQFGINSINTYDLTKLRYPGSELKNVFVPVPLVYAQLGVTDEISFEAFYQLGNEKVVVDPQGSLFGQVDGLATGGEFLILESVFFEQNDLPDGYRIFRRKDKDARKDGQFGFALTAIVPDWNSMEFGLFFMNIHSSLPLTSGYALSEAQWQQYNEISATGTQDPSGLTGVLLVRGLLAPESLSAAQIEKLRGIHGVGGYRLEYPEDIQVTGISFNTDTPLGVALQGEFSWRHGQPFQIDDYELVYHGLAPVTQLAGPVGGTAFSMFFPENQLGQDVAPGSYFQGYRRMDMLQWQLTGTYLWGPDNPFKAEQWTILVEFGATKILDMPDKAELRFEGPGTFQKGGTEGVSDNYYSEDFGWGYRVLTFLNYANFLGSSWNFTPTLTFFHDINGTPAGPARSFIEDSMQAQASMRFEYLGRWAFDLSYISFFGVGKDYRNTNLLHDRDSAAFSVKYAF